MRKTTLFLALLLSAILVGSPGFAAGKSFRTELTGKDEVPPTTSQATGRADFKLTKDGKSLRYYISVRNIVNPNAAHIHTGKAGQNGPPVANLYAGPKKQGKVNGKFTEGTLTDKDLMGSLQGKTISDLVSLINSGDAYVNVHTDANPNGEIRGQIK